MELATDGSTREVVDNNGFVRWAEKKKCAWGQRKYYDCHATVAIVASASGGNTESEGNEDKINKEGKAKQRKRGFYKCTVQADIGLERQ